MTPFGQLSRYNNRTDHQTWTFQFRTRPGKLQKIQKIDLDAIGDRNQIIIWDSSVRSFIQQCSAGCNVRLHLPQRVQRVIIFRTGYENPLCFAEECGKKVFPGHMLVTKENPFTYKKQLQRLWLSRRRRKHLF